MVSCELSVFFSSRRRHTRFDCDWSSDVCSSDLLAQRGRRAYRAQRREAPIHHRAKLVAERFQSREDRKSTRLNSSHSQISYAVFCLKKKKTSRYLPRPSTVFSPRIRRISLSHTL